MTLLIGSGPATGKACGIVNMARTHLKSTETTRLIRDGEMEGRVYGGGGRGGRGRVYAYRYAVTTRMIPALRWAAIRAV